MSLLKHWDDKLPYLMNFYWLAYRFTTQGSLPTIFTTWKKSNKIVCHCYENKSTEYEVEATF
jgi:hypothetical protein